MSDSLIDTTELESTVTEDSNENAQPTTEQESSTEAPKENERPEGIPDDFWDAESKSLKADALLEGYKSEAKQKADMRAIISKGLGKPAENIEEFDNVEIAENVQRYVAEDDPALAVAKEAAFETGIPVDKLTDFVNKYLSKGGEKGFLHEVQPQLTEEEQATLQKAEDDKFKAEQMEILGDEGKRNLDMIKNEVKVGLEKGKFSKEDIEAFENAAYDAKGVNFIAKLIKTQKGQQIIPTEHVIDKGMPTLDELDAMGADPRMQTDPGFRAKRTEGYKYYEKIGVLK